MKKIKGKFSIKYKLMLIMLTVLFLSVGLIAFMSFNLIQKDKITYIYDLNFSVAKTLSEQLKLSLLNKKNLLEGLLSVYVYSGNKWSSEGFFLNNKDVISVSFWRLKKDKKEGVSYVLREKVLKNEKIFESDIFDNLSRVRKRFPLNLSNLNQSKSFLINSTISSDFPVYTIAFLSDRFSDVIVVADLSGDMFKKIFSQEDIFNAYIVDIEGKLIGHREIKKMYERQDLSKTGIVKNVIEQISVGGVTEYLSLSGEQMLGAYSLIPAWGLGVIVEAPKKLAYLGARNLIRNLILISGFILLGSIVLVIIFARSLSKPIISLSAATKDISEGKFSTKIKTKSSDEIGQLAKDFNLMTDKLDEITAQLIQSTKMASIGDLSRSIGHEFGNVLTAIMGNTELILMDDTINDEVRKRANVIIDGAERANMIVQNLKGISKSEEKVLEETEILICLESAILLAEPEYISRGLKIEKNFSKNYIVVIDERQISQVFLNLLINGGHAMTRGGVMKISLEEEAGFIKINFSDTGSGIQEKNIEKIFEPLFTTKGSSGTGLGLAVSRDIIRDHGGEMSVKSEVNVGTTFFVKLPLQ